jgi:hypothetical protein
MQNRASLSVCNMYIIGQIKKERATTPFPNQFKLNYK